LKLKFIRKLKTENMIGEGNVISYNNPMIHPGVVQRDEHWSNVNE
jgi:hypothetical protein